MTIYSVKMGYGISHDLSGGDSLYTGSPPAGDALQSCSAVVMADYFGGAGLYHFPAANFKIPRDENEAAEARAGFQIDERAQTILNGMYANLLSPDLYLFSGTAPGADASVDTGVDALRRFLQTLSRTEPTVQPATGGVVCVSEGPTFSHETVEVGARTEVSADGKGPKFYS